MTISALRQQLLSGDVSARELVDQHLERIASVDSKVHAFLEITAERARADADRALLVGLGGLSHRASCGIARDTPCTHGKR